MVFLAASDTGEIDKMRLTARQTEVLGNIELVKTDGSRVYPQYRIDDKNVTPQVNSLLKYGLVELRGASLTAVEQPRAPSPTRVDTKAAVDAMRDFLSG